MFEESRRNETLETQQPRSTLGLEMYHNLVEMMLPLMLSTETFKKKLTRVSTRNPENSAIPMTGDCCQSMMDTTKHLLFQSNCQNGVGLNCEANPGKPQFSTERKLRRLLGLL